MRVVPWPWRCLACAPRSVFESRPVVLLPREEDHAVALGWRHWLGSFFDKHTPHAPEEWQVELAYLSLPCIPLRLKVNSGIRAASALIYEWRHSAMIMLCRGCASRLLAWCGAGQGFPQVVTLAVTGSAFVGAHWRPRSTNCYKPSLPFTRGTWVPSVSRLTLTRSCSSTLVNVARIWVAVFIGQVRVAFNVGFGAKCYRHAEGTSIRDNTSKLHTSTTTSWPTLKSSCASATTTATATGRV